MKKQLLKLGYWFVDFLKIYIVKIQILPYFIKLKYKKKNMLMPSL